VPDRQELIEVVQHVLSTAPYEASPSDIEELAAPVVDAVLAALQDQPITDEMVKRARLKIAEMEYDHLDEQAAQQKDSLDDDWESAKARAALEAALQDQGE
jgi:hypothetical protein